MREIKFKAKTVIGNEWINSMTIAKGNIKRKERLLYMEIFSGWKQIIPETLCEFTGFKDIEGNDAYENDIIEQNEPITFRDGCFFSGHIPLALVIEHRKITGNIFDK